MELVKLEAEDLKNMTEGSVEDLIELDKEQLLDDTLTIKVGHYKEEHSKAFMIARNNVPVFYVSYRVLRKWILLNQYPTYEYNLKKELGLIG